MVGEGFPQSGIAAAVAGQDVREGDFAALRRRYVDVRGYGIPKRILTPGVARLRATAVAFVDAVTGLVGGDIKEALERQLWTIERTDASYLEAPYRTTHAPSARRTHMPKPFDRWSRRDLCERGSFSLNGRGA